MVETTAVASTSQDGPDQLFRRLRSTTKGYHEHIQALSLAQSVAIDQKYAYIPRREMYVLEWLLERMLKTREEAEPPLLTPSSWALLRQILQKCEESPRQADLRQLVSRVPFMSLFASMLNRLSEALPRADSDAFAPLARKGKRKADAITNGDDELEKLLEDAYAVFQHYHQLSPHPGANQVDGALSCFGAWLARAVDADLAGSLTAGLSLTEHLVKLGTLFIGHYSTLAHTDKNAAKKAQAFALSENFWPNLLRALSHRDAGIVDVSRNILQACLFTSASLARNLPSIPSSTAFLSIEACRTSSLISALKQALAQASRHVSAVALVTAADVAPLMYSAVQSYMSRLGQRFLASTTNMVDVDRTPSTKSTTRQVEALTSARNMAFSFIEITLDLFEKVSAAQRVRSMKTLLQVVVDGRMYAPRVQESSEAWRGILRRVLDTLLSVQISEQGECNDFCAAVGLLLDLDYDLITPRLSSVLRFLLEVEGQQLSNGEAIIIKLIGEASKSRALLELVQSLTDATRRPRQASSSKPAYFSISSRKALSTACAADLSAEQSARLLLSSIDQVSQCIQSFLPTSISTGMHAYGSTLGDKSASVSLEAMQALVQLHCSLFLALQAMLANEAKALMATATSRLMTQVEESLLDMPDNFDVQNGMACCLQLHRISAQALHISAIPSDMLLDALQRHVKPDVDTAALLPILTLEIAQCVASAVLISSQAERLADCILQVTTAYDPSAIGEWNGNLQHLTASTLCIAVWQLALRHLPNLFARHCTDLQLTAFADYLLRTCSTPAIVHTNTCISSLSTTFLRNSASYELVRLQKAVVATLEDESCLISRYLSGIALLPPDWLSKSVRRTVCSRVAAISPPTDVIYRVLLNMTAHDVGNPLSVDPNFMRELSHVALDSFISRALYMQLLRLTFCHWNATPSRYAFLQDFVLSHDVLTSKGNDMAGLHLFCMGLEALLVETKATSIPLAEMIWLVQTARSATTTIQRSLVQRALGSDRLVSSLQAALTLAKFREWCSLEGERIGFELEEAIKAKTSFILRTAKDDRIPLLLLNIDSLSVGQDGRPSLEEFSAQCVHVSHVFPQAMELVQDILKQTASRQTVSELTRALETLSRALLLPSNVALVHAVLPCLTTLICSDTIDSTPFRLESHYISTIIKILPSMLSSRAHENTWHAVVAFLRGVCDQRVASLELHDVGSLLKIVQTYLLGAVGGGSASPHHAHQDSDQATVVDEIIQLLTSLALYRRDLLLPLFAPFCRLVGLLVACVQIEPSIAGAPANTSVLEKLAVARGYKWSRLLMSLCTKGNNSQRRGSGRIATISDRKRNTEQISLVGALSKHAPFILFAYLQRGANTQTSFGPSIRSALLPGVHALIGVMGQHEREALMKGFLTDKMSVERDLLRALWADYDKTRYKGN